VSKNGRFLSGEGPTAGAARPGLFEMAELHVVGQVLGGSGFQLDNLFCKWSIEAGSNFRLLQGLAGGQTHCDYPNVRCSPGHLPSTALPTDAAQGGIALVPPSAPHALHRPTKPPCGATRLTCTGRSRASTVGRGCRWRCGASTSSADASLVSSARGGQTSARRNMLSRRVARTDHTCIVA
jgi:hypothetical protein